MTTVATKTQGHDDLDDLELATPSADDLAALLVKKERPPRPARSPRR